MEILSITSPFLGKKCVPAQNSEKEGTTYYYISDDTTANHLSQTFFIVPVLSKQMRVGRTEKHLAIITIGVFFSSFL